MDEYRDIGSENRGSNFRNFMKQFNNLGPPKWHISEPTEQKYDYQVLDSVDFASTLQSFDNKQDGNHLKNYAEPLELKR